MGNFDYDEFDNVKLVGTWFPAVFVIFVMAILNITLLNFVIAILSNTYGKLTNLSVSVYLKFVIS